MAELRLQGDEMYELLSTVRRLTDEFATLSHLLQASLDAVEPPPGTAARAGYDRIRLARQAEHVRFADSLRQIEARLAHIAAKSEASSESASATMVAEALPEVSTPHGLPKTQRGSRVQTEWVYFNDAPGRRAATDGLTAFTLALEELGAEEVTVVGEPVLGSIWSTVKAMFGAPAKYNEAKDHIQRAMAGTRSADATASLIAAVSPNGADNVVIAEKSKLLVKRTNPDGSTSLYVGPLTRKGYKQIRSHPEWFQTPEELPFLAREEHVGLPPPVPARPLPPPPPEG